MKELIKRAAEDLAAAGNVAALTGAGISTESGIPPFRGKGGLWERFDPMEFAHIDALMRDPAKVWRVLVKEMKEMLDRAKPNDGHKGLAILEARDKLKTIITQNVDGLHQAAGNTDVIEYHGTLPGSDAWTVTENMKPSKWISPRFRRAVNAAEFCGRMPSFLVKRSPPKPCGAQGRRPSIVI